MNLVLALVAVLNKDNRIDRKLATFQRVMRRPISYPMTVVSEVLADGVDPGRQVTRNPDPAALDGDRHRHAEGRETSIEQDAVIAEIGISVLDKGQT